jgi:hypothetical protein
MFGITRPTLSDTPQVVEALALLDDAYFARLKRPGRSARHSVEVAELLLAALAAAPTRGG